ncbi:MAG: ribosomal protein S18-alanine N-acetyltransferase [Oscillospiraceae bacterium]|nr:ribosomal protein S18-alanine N-acetyltransferase [Oscillospiraceae bacterium]
MDYRILPVTEALLPKLKDLEALCFSVPWTLAMFEEELSSPHAAYFAAENPEGALLGYAGLQFVMDEGYVTNVAVHPAARRKGVGSALLRALLAFCGEKGLSFLSLEVRESNGAARSLYQSFGFQAVGLRKNYYARPREDALLMTKFMDDLSCQR